MISSWVTQETPNLVPHSLVIMGTRYCRMRYHAPMEGVRKSHNRPTPSIGCWADCGVLDGMFCSTPLSSKEKWLGSMEVSRGPYRVLIRLLKTLHCQGPASQGAWSHPNRPLRPSSRPLSDQALLSLHFRVPNLQALGLSTTVSTPEGSTRIPEA